MFYVNIKLVRALRFGNLGGLLGSRTRAGNGPRVLESSIPLVHPLATSNRSPIPKMHVYNQTNRDESRRWRHRQRRKRHCLVRFCWGSSVPLQRRRCGRVGLGARSVGVGVTDGSETLRRLYCRMKESLCARGQGQARTRVKQCVCVPGQARTLGFCMCSRGRWMGGCESDYCQPPEGFGIPQGQKMH